jgi:hypothetical protein
MYVCLSVCLLFAFNSKSILQNVVKFGGMIGHDLRNKRLDFGSDRVKGQGQAGQRSRSRKGKKRPFGDISVIYCPIGMKLTPKCGE